MKLKSSSSLCLSCPTGFAGTPGYLAPEVCSRLSYGLAVDMWAVGEEKG